MIKSTNRGKSWKSIASNLPEKHLVWRIVQDHVNKDLLFIGQSYDIELKYNNPKKGEVWIRNVAQPIYNKQNKVVGKRGVLQDITASKIAQQELEISNQKIKTTLDLLEKSEYSKNDASKMAKIGYLEEEINTDKRVWSESLYHIFGFDIKSGPPTTEEIASLFSEEFQIKIVESIANLDVNGVPFDIELQMTNIRKEKIWIRAMLHPIYNQNKELTGRRGVIQDITDQKIKQQELDQKNEELYKVNNALNEAQKLSRIGNWEWNMQTDEAIWSDEMYNIYGVTRDSFYPSHKNVSKTVYPDDRHKFKTAINSLLVNKIFVPFEFRMIHPSGELRHLYIMALEKKFDYNVFGVTKDITDRKKIELKNKIITDRYIELFDNATVSIWNEDLTLVFKEINKLRKLAIPNIKVYLEENPELMFFLLKKVKINKVNKATLKLFDAKNSEQFLDNIELTFGKDADKVFAGLIEAIWNNNKTYVSEVNYKTIKGVEFAAIVSIPIPQTTTEQKTVPVSIQSIQSIKVAEAAKIDSIKKLNEAQKIAKIGSWLYIPLTQEVIWSEETYRIFGYDPKKEPPNFKVLLKSINIKDQELVFNSFNSEASFDIEHRNYMPNGDEKWIRTICEPTFDEKGVLISFRGSNQDITERKLISRKIEKAEEMYRLLADNSNDLICLHEPDSTFKYISPSIKDILGYDASEKIGKLGFSLIYKEDVQIFRESIEQRIFNKIPNTTFYCRAQHKNGDILWLEFSASAVFSNNKPDYILTSSRDITEWMLAKQEIQEYQASLQKLTAEGEIFYFQKRIGLKNEYFNIWKFATMLKDSPNIGSGSITLRNDPRVTPVGKYLRITKLNELPQIINVLKGDMSIVGPRPLVDRTFQAYSKKIQETIYNSKPGITGIGSIIFRDEEDLLTKAKEEGNDPWEFYKNYIYPYKGEVESWYQKNQSFGVDFMILFLTAWAIVFPKSDLHFKIFKDIPKRNF